jgi:hypothetical protein
MSKKIKRNNLINHYIITNQTFIINQVAVKGTTRRILRKVIYFELKLPNASEYSWI